MPKQKNVTDDEVKALDSALYELIGKGQDIATRMGNGYCDDLPTAGEVSQSCICYARDLLNFAMRLRTQHDLHTMKAETDRMVRDAAASK